MGLDHQRATVGIDHGVALSALDLRAGVVAARAAGLGRLDALAVDHRCRGEASRNRPAGAAGC